MPALPDSNGSANGRNDSDTPTETMRSEDLSKEGTIDAQTRLARFRSPKRAFSSWTLSSASELDEKIDPEVAALVSGVFSPIDESPPTTAPELARKLFLPVSYGASTLSIETNVSGGAAEELLALAGLSMQGLAKEPVEVAVEPWRDPMLPLPNDASDDTLDQGLKLLAEGVGAEGANGVDRSWDPWLLAPTLGLGASKRARSPSLSSVCSDRSTTKRLKFWDSGIGLLSDEHFEDA